MSNKNKVVIKADEGNGIKQPAEKMKHFQALQKFIEHVNRAGNYFIYDASFQHHFEKWVMLPKEGRRFKMNEEDFKTFSTFNKAKFSGFCTYAQGIGLDAL